MSKNKAINHWILFNLRAAIRSIKDPGIGQNYDPSYPTLPSLSVGDLEYQVFSVYMSALAGAGAGVGSGETRTGAGSGDAQMGVGSGGDTLGGYDTGYKRSLVNGAVLLQYTKPNIACTDAGTGIGTVTDSKSPLPSTNHTISVSTGVSASVGVSVTHEAWLLSLRGYPTVVGEVAVDYFFNYFFNKYINEREKGHNYDLSSSTTGTAEMSDFRYIRIVTDTNYITSTLDKGMHCLIFQLIFSL